MALPASSVLPSLPKLQVKEFKYKTAHLHGSLSSRVCCQIFPLCCMKITTGQFGDMNNMKKKLRIVKERLWESIPDPVKEFPWKKAEDMLLVQLLALGWKAFKWSVMPVFVYSSLSDVVFSISRNQELLIPLGLLLGCLMTDFLKETSREMFQSSEEKSLSRHLLAIGSFFVVVKFISICFTIKARVLLLHVANGGLMEVLWLWKHLVKEDEGDDGNFSSRQDASSDVAAET
ncbi:hypothetical protein SLE2022_114230 [Rubroshorea leprosula]